MDIGRLNQRVSIEQRTSEQDAIGEPVELWSNVATVWADIRHLSGIETIRADSEISIIKASIRIRYRAGLTSGMRVVCRSNYYNINAIIEDSRREFIDLVCEKVDD